MKSRREACLRCHSPEDQTKLEPPSSWSAWQTLEETRALTTPLCGRANECGVSYPIHSPGMNLALCILPPGGHGPGELGIWVSRCLAPWTNKCEKWGLVFLICYTDMLVCVSQAFLI